MKKLTAILLACVASLTACEKVSEKVEKVSQTGDQLDTAVNEAVSDTTGKLMAVVEGGQAGMPAILANSPTLDPQDLVLAVYQEQMFDVAITPDRAEEYELDGTISTGVAVDDIRYLAVFRELKEYVTPDGQVRYLALLERINLDADNDWDFPMTGHVSSAGVDFAVFVALPEGGFGLIQKHSIAETAGAYGRAAIFAQNENLSPLVRVGKDKMGLIYQSGYTSTGVTEVYDRIVLINDQSIEEVAIAQTQYDDEASGMFDPPASYSGKIVRIDDGEPTREHYPIVIRFTGTQRNEDNQVEPYNQTTTYEYNGNGEKYHAVK